MTRPAPKPAGSEVGADAVVMGPRVRVVRGAALDDGDILLVRLPVCSFGLTRREAADLVRDLTEALNAR